MPLANSAPGDASSVSQRAKSRVTGRSSVRDRDEVVRADEDVELGSVQPLDRLVVDGEVEDDEEIAVLLVVVDLRALTLRDDVLDVERMPAEALRQHVPQGFERVRGR